MIKLDPFALFFVKINMFPFVARATYSKFTPLFTFFILFYWKQLIRNRIWAWEKFYNRICISDNSNTGLSIIGHVNYLLFKSGCNDKIIQKSYFTPRFVCVILISSYLACSNEGSFCKAVTKPEKPRKHLTKGGGTTFSKVMYCFFQNTILIINTIYFSNPMVKWSLKICICYLWW